MKRMDKVVASQLQIGDRFYGANDKDKVVKEIVNPTDGKMMSCIVAFVGSPIQHKIAVPIKDNAPVIFLRNIKN